MKRTRISNLQFIITTSGFVFGNGPLFISSSVARIAGRDAWISAIFATILGLSSVWINNQLRVMYPDKTLIELIHLLLGKWLGNIFAIIYIFTVLVTGTQITWYVGDLITTIYIPEASPYIVNVLFIAALAVALLYGLETMYRAVTILFYFTFPLYICTLLFLIPNIKVENLLPIMENGINPVLTGSIPLLALSVWPLIVLNMITLSDFSEPKKTKRSNLYGYLLGMATAFVGVIMCILVLGDTITANYRYPLFILSREVNVGIILSRIEAIVVAVWLNTNLVSTFFYIYMGVKGISQLLKLDDYKNIVIPIGLILAVFSQFIYKNVPYQIRWDTETWPALAFTMGFVTPVILLIIAAVRKLSAKSKT